MAPRGRIYIKHKIKKEVLLQLLRPIAIRQKFGIRHTAVRSYSTKYGSVILNSRRALRDNRYRFKKTSGVQVLSEALKTKF